MATSVELAKSAYPAQYKGMAITPTMGISLLPTLKGETGEKHERLYNEHYKARYVREEDWKLVSTSKDTTWHLYKINQDQTELNDIATENPDQVKRLAAEWKRWAATHQVYPKPH